MSDFSIVLWSPFVKQWVIIVGTVKILLKE